MKKLIITILAVIFLMGCVTIEHGEVRRRRKASKNHRHYKISYNYRYYYDCNIYYDEGRRVYFYYHHGWWRMVVDLPQYKCIKRNDYSQYIRVKLDVSEPYREHDKVLKHVPRGKAKGHYKNKRRH